MVETDIFPAGPKPPGGTLAYQEIVGKSTNVATIEIGNASHSGAAIQVFPDHIHIKVKVRGQPALGLPGKFKAFYRVFWKSP